MLTSKQRAFLKGLSNKVNTMFQIGKGGLSDNQIAEIEILLEKHELVKIHVLENSLEDPRSVCDEVVSRIDGCEPVFVIGKRFVIYKQSKENKRIDLVHLRIKEKEEKKAPAKASKPVASKGKRNAVIRTKAFSFGSGRTGAKGARGGFGTKRSRDKR
ncbi:MAG: YhbY family RNA-binding protein [Clostridia bacterium]|nr:YhbY family RNA-binding protein [Clostridia bacterium]